MNIQAQVTRGYTSGLSLPQKLELAIPLGESIEVAKKIMHETFAAETLKIGEFLDREQLLKVIRKAAEESARVSVEILRTSEIVQRLLGDQAGAYVRDQMQKARAVGMFRLILMYSPSLLYLYTNGRRDLTEPEITDIVQRAAIEIIDRLQIPGEYIEDVKESLIPGLTSPDSLALV